MAKTRGRGRAQALALALAAIASAALMLMTAPGAFAQDEGCGDGTVGSGICPNPFDCCSKDGWCMHTEAHCGEGCQGGPCTKPGEDFVPYFPPLQPPPSPPSYPPPPNTTPCGAGVVGNMTCVNPLHCCSKDGWCLYTEAHCGEGCLGGPCTKPGEAFVPYVPPSPPPPKPPAPPPPPNLVPCGDGVVGNGTCPNPQDCCSEAGWCQYTEAHCGAGCQGGPCTRPGAKFAPRPPAPRPPRVMQFCGDGVIGNKTCPNRYDCCSAEGWCMHTEAHCGEGCLGGPCTRTGRVFAHYSPPRSPPRPPPPPPNMSPCGGGVVGNGTCPNPLDCCSSEGWCMHTEAHCGAGCQGGPCTPPGAPFVPYSPPSRPPPSRTPCGDGVVGNGQCPAATDCCSEHGWCGTTDAHCSAPGCHGGPCTPPPGSNGRRRLRFRLWF